jgi:tyrosyl-tRNA synthetase
MSYYSNLSRENAKKSNQASQQNGFYVNLKVQIRNAMINQTKQLTIGIADEIFKLVPNYRRAVLVVQEVRNVQSNESLRQKLDAEIARVKELVMNDDSRLIAWREAFELAGIKPNKFRPSVDALVHRLLNGGTIPSISAIVDIGTIISLRYLLPCGAHSLDDVDSELILRRARGTESFTPFGSTDNEIIASGEVIYTDGNIIATDKWAWRQANHTIIESSTTAFELNIDALSVIDDAVLALAVQDAQDLIRETFGVQATSYVLQAAVGSVEIAIGVASDAIRSNASEMTLSEELLWRGMIKDHTFADLKWLDTPRAFYLGSDCSNDSLTIGNLAIYMQARRLVERGWKAVLLVGGATSLIGDPGGKNEERQLKTFEEIEQNVSGIKKQVERLFAGYEFMTVNNYDWFKDVGYLDFLRDVGKHYSMTELVQRDFIATRMGEGGGGISYAEFSYNLIQGYDYWWLYKYHNVELQIGGSDQWGNMLSGAPLIRKKEGIEVHCLSIPLVINKTTGQKFGKSEAGAIWLDEQKTSVYQFYQFWLNTDDARVGDFLKIYTLLDYTAIETLMTAFEQSPNGRVAQKTLAYEITKLVHGADKASAVQKATDVLFGSGDYRSLGDMDLQILKAELPVIKAELNERIIALAVKSGLAASNSEAARLITDGGISLNGQKVTDTQTSLTQAGDNLLKRGKNAFAIIEAS